MLLGVAQFAVQAIREFGILRGLVLAGWRLLRCNPFSRGGLDPVSAAASVCFAVPRRGKRSRKA